MKKILSVVALLFLANISYAQKKSSKRNVNTDGKYLLVGVSYSMPKRTEFDKYISIISDSLKLKNALNVNKAYGGHFSVFMRAGKSEIEAGIFFAKTLSFKESNATNTAGVIVSNNNIDIHFGYNRLISKNIFWGMDFGMLSNSGKITSEGIAFNYFESTPESNNPFKGYQFVFRPKFGFNFPVNENMGFKLNGFYDIALNKYEFYSNDILNSRLKNYKGSTKSSYSNLGAQFSFYISF